MKTYLLGALLWPHDMDSWIQRIAGLALALLSVACVHSVLCCIPSVDLQHAKIL